MARSFADAKIAAEKVLKELARHVSVRRAFLFGSYVTGTATEDSDIDLAVFSPDVEKMTIEEKVSLIARVGQAVGEPVEIHLLSSRRLQDSSPAQFAGFVSTKGREISLAG
jgi:predicted nucleotidyltransferase